MRTTIPVRGKDVEKISRSILLGFVLFLMCVFGVLTRPVADLASLWPANAFMLGMLIRFPTLAHPLSWVACATGFAFADLLTGGSLLKTVVLNLGNLTAITIGYLFLSRFKRADQRLSRPASVLFMLVAISAAAGTAGVFGTVADPILFGGHPLDALLYWSATELVNYVAFLPMILTFPDNAWQKLSSLSRRRPDAINLLPFFALIATALAGALIGGPGAVAFPVLALLWCALSYNLFATACLAFGFVAWTLLAISSGYLPVADNISDRSALLSVRFAVSLTGIAPLIVASVMAAREELVQQLLHLSRHDQMTGLLNRAAFLEVMERQVGAWGRTTRPVAVLMLDIDHFKAINDQYGHAAGDQVLVAFAQILRQSVRKTDFAGRLGGEEFAAFLEGCEADEAREIATRVNGAFSAAQIFLDDGRQVTATVSIGVATGCSPPADAKLLTIADAALYDAKNLGRNRVHARTVPPR